MNVEINKKKYKIKPASELTVREYITFLTSISENPKEMEVIICYIASITGLSFKDITSVNIDKTSLRRISVYIGEIVIPDKLKGLDSFYYRKPNKKIYKRNINWRSFGVRQLIEDRKADNNMDLAVYLLAIYIDGNYDNEQIEEIYKDLQDYNAASVFGFVLFFFKSLSNGKISVANYLRLQATKAKISTQKLLRR